MSLVLVLEFLILSHMINSVHVERFELDKNLIDVSNCEVESSIIVKCANSSIFIIMDLMLLVLINHSRINALHCKEDSQDVCKGNAIVLFTFENTPEVKEQFPLNGIRSKINRQET